MGSMQGSTFGSRKIRWRLDCEDRTTRGSLSVQFGSPEAAVRGGVSAASESACASIAVMLGESRQRDGSTSFADPSISARRSLS